MKQTAILILIISMVYSCGSGGNSKGDLIGVKTKSKWHSETPTGMVLVPGGTFTMGKQDEDPVGALNTPPVPPQLDLFIWTKQKSLIVNTSSSFFG